MKVSTDKEDKILSKIKPDHDDAKKYYTNYLEPEYIKRTKLIESDKDYYAEMFKTLQKIPMTTSEVHDTIMWILPALVETFSSPRDVVDIQPEGGEDAQRSDKVQELLNFQTERQNEGFMNRYYWMLSCLEMNIGFLKVSWEQEKQKEEQEVMLDDNGLMMIPPQVNVKSQEIASQGDGITTPNIYRVVIENERTIKNQPRIEALSVTDVRWNSSAKKLREAKFVQHKTSRTLNYLYQKQSEGLYFNIDKVRDEVGKASYSNLEQTNNPYINQQIEYDKEDLRRDIDVYECYTEYDLDDKGKLKPYIFTVAGDCSVLIGIQENTMGRLHPIFDLLAMPDQKNVVPKIGLPELLGEIQNINTALTKLLVKHLIKSNAGKRFVDKSKVDQDDILNEADDIGVNGSPRDAVYPMPPTNLSPMTMPFFQLQQSSLESKVGVTKYNTGTDSAHLNDTATGVTALIDQANKKIKLIARVMAEHYRELYRFLISLNQQYIDEPQVVRLLNKKLEVTPDDLDGKFDLIISTGLGGTNKQAEIQMLQLLMGTLEKVRAMNPNMVTDDKVYNIIKLLLEQMDKKNVDDFINNPDIAKQIQMMQQENQMMKAKLMQIEQQRLNPMGGQQAIRAPSAGFAGLPQQVNQGAPAGAVQQVGNNAGFSPSAGIPPGINPNRG